ncbi:putative acyltransferase [Sphaerochaeta pleomorpha str. Grapes]|uniref:Putative acyltransferase n=2 Tax=Sphaerochaeta TaxID=399320 RepID=G8QUG5_SPHPG|nr:putative acyltransferase [Sphaerochaeta pleomorpha str. Grapes]
MAIMEQIVIYIEENAQGNTLYQRYLSECQAIRKTVFIEGQDVAPEIDLDGLDTSCAHLLLLLGEKPAATLRIRKTAEGTKLERVAVLQEFRGHNYGKLLVQCALALSEPPVYIHAQVPSEGFYKNLGFTVEDPTIFYEANIPHRTMFWPNHIKGKTQCNIIRLS